MNLEMTGELKQQIGELFMEQGLVSDISELDDADEGILLGYYHDTVLYPAGKVTVETHYYETSEIGDKYWLESVEQYFGESYEEAREREDDILKTRIEDIP